MDFAFTEEQERIRDAARRFARERLAPSYQAREAAGAIERGLLREMGGLGLIAADLGEEFGGLAADGVTCGVIMEEIAAGDFNVG
jgi:cyclohexanecarboxyl-CoA dehydrogenase